MPMALLVFSDAGIFLLQMRKYSEIPFFHQAYTLLSLALYEVLSSSWLNVLMWLV